MFANKKAWLVVAGVAAIAGSFAFFSKDDAVDFSAEVKPILNKNCLSCHGGVRAKGGFSLLFREEALANTESGKPAIIPGDPDHSEFIRRLTVKDPEQRMPYKHEPLPAEEIALLKRWVKQGAKWGDHWAYLPVKQQTIPKVTVESPDKNGPWGVNEIDAFIGEKLAANNLQPNKEADKATLLRRVSLDLIGTYPTNEQSKHFLESKDPNAYEQLVDSLLASERFGEKWTSMWLDLARYADTKGYESDQGRNVWAYRDWVIRAFNNNMPYDQFINEQIAGDLLPDPTDAQLIATTFHRNAPNNDEGGTDNEEFRNSGNLDRVNTTWEGLLSSTFACVQCHSHPYDPFRHDEYYQFLAYFDNNRDEDVSSEAPYLRQFSDSDRNSLTMLTQWVQQQAGTTEAKRVKTLVQTFQPAINSFRADSLKNATVINNNGNLAMFNDGWARLPKANLEKADEGMMQLVCYQPGAVIDMHLDSMNGPVFARVPVAKEDKWKRQLFNFPQQSGIHDVFMHFKSSAFKPEPGKNPPLLVFFDFFSFQPSLPGKNAPGYQQAKSDYTRLLVNTNTSGIPIMQENPAAWQHSTYVWERGNRHLKGKDVTPAVPAVLRFAQPANAPANRLGLAQWLTDKRNPLLSRTLVNRFWEQLFGTGIVETLEDMGTQGISPTHQALLDQLSYRFMNDYTWNMKQLLKEMVMSATYRQVARWNDKAAEDAANKLYARGPRVRLSAEQIRDQALAASGLISYKMYGPGVMPYQPDGIWLSPYNGARWHRSQGEDQYRRAVYTYWKRSSPYPSSIGFDAAQRNVCSARRIRTNTPLQALTTLNDSAFIDMSRHFAQRMTTEAGSDPAKQISRGYELLLYKTIAPKTLQVFTDLYRQSLTEFKSHPDKAIAFLPANNNANPELAALTVVANAMMNLDEVITK